MSPVRPSCQSSERAIQFQRNGFVALPQFFALEEIEAFERAVDRLGRILLKRAGVDPLPTGTLDLFRFMERERPDLFYQLCSSAGGTLEGYTLATSASAGSLLREVDNRNTLFFPVFPALFYNDRCVERLQYDWHQEASYFAGVENTQTIWFPLFRDISDEDGPMLIAEGSHAEHLPYELERREGALTQLRILEDVEKTFEIYRCVCRRGDAILFSDKAAHCTGQNRSGLPRISGIIRYVDATSAKRFQPMMTFSYKDSPDLAEKIGGGAGAPAE